MAVLSTLLAVAVGVFFGGISHKVYDDFQKSRAKIDLTKKFEEKYNTYTTSMLSEIKNDPNFCGKNISILYNKKDIEFKKKLAEIINPKELKELIKFDLTEQFNDTAETMSKKSIKHLNIMVIGNSGVGKSLLINKILELGSENEAKSKMLKPTTKELQEYTSQKMPKLRIVDSRGIEKINYNIEKLISDIKDYIIKKENEGEPDKFIHCIWYCLTGNRIEEIEEETMKNLSSLYHNSTLPIIVVYTQATIPEYYNTFEKYVKKNFPNFSFIPVLAKEFDTNSGAKEKSFGLDKLIQLSMSKAKSAIYSSVFTTLSNKVKEFAKEKIKIEFENIISNQKIEINKKTQIVFEELLNIHNDSLINELNIFLNSIDMSSDTFNIKKKCIKKFLKENTEKLTNSLIDIQSKVFNEYRDYLKDLKTRNDIESDVKEKFEKDIKGKAELKVQNVEKNIISNKRKEVYKYINEIILNSFDQESNNPELNKMIQSIIQKYFSQLEKNINSFK